MTWRRDSIVPGEAEAVPDLVEAPQAGEDHHLAFAQSGEDGFGFLSGHKFGEVGGVSAVIHRAVLMALFAIRSDERDVLEMFLVLAFRQKSRKSSQDVQVVHGHPT
jgi:hypothetical protein